MSKYVYHIENRFGLQFSHAPTIKRCLERWGSEGFDRCAMFRTDSDGNKMMVDACGKRKSEMSRAYTLNRGRNKAAGHGSCPTSGNNRSYEKGEKNENESS